MRGLALLLVALFFGPRSSLARARDREARVQWSEVPGASAYELRVVDEAEKAVFSKKLPKGDVQWSGRLPTGAFRYQIRALDWAGRPGRWTKPRALIALAPAPEILSPEDSATFSSFDPTQSVTVRWKEVRGAGEYAVEVTRDGEKFQARTTEAHSLPLSHLPPGDYVWEVAAVVRLGGTSYPGERSSRHFRIEQKKLAAPELSSPQGALPPSLEPSLGLAWPKVPFAEAYELKFLDRTAGTEEVSLTHAPHKTVSVAPGHAYHWSVRALAGLAPHAAPAVTGPVASQDFRMRELGPTYRSPDTISFSLGPWFYNEQTSGPNNPNPNSQNQNFGGETQGGARGIQMILAGEKWIAPHWAVAARAGARFLHVDGHDRADFDVEPRVRYWVDLLRPLGVSIYPFLGLGVRSLPVIPGAEQNPRGYGNGSLTTLGPSWGFELRKPFTERFSLSWIVELGVPALVLHRPSYVDASARLVNFSVNQLVGLQGTYWLTPATAFRLGLFDNELNATLNHAYGYQALQVRVSGPLLLFTFSCRPSILSSW